MAQKLDTRTERDERYTYDLYPFYNGPFDPRKCPSTRAGHETQHTCSPVGRDTCTAPSYWEDHCHVYEWFLDYRGGNEERMNDLLTYYKRRVEEAIVRRYKNFDWNEMIALGMEALMRVLTKYDPTFGVPTQAYIRQQLPRRFTDVLRENGIFSRASADFHRKVNDVMNADGNLTEEQAAERLVGTHERPNRGGATLTQERVRDLVRLRQISQPLSIDLALEDGSIPAQEMTSDSDTEMEAQALESARNASTVVGALTEGMSDFDRDLALAFSAGPETLEVFARRNGLTLTEAKARARAVVSRLQGRAAEMLNVSMATLASHSY